MTEKIDPERFVARLSEHQSDDELRKMRRYFKTGAGGHTEGDVFMGVRMGQVFALAKEFVEMTPDQIEVLLGDDVHEVRAGGLSIMDEQARRKSTPAARRQELFDLYLRNAARINNWDLVDKAAVHVVGRYLVDKPRDVLDTLARSSNLWERRTAVIATLFFIRAQEFDDTERIAILLLGDPEDMVQKPIGTVLREMGRRDRPRLLAFLQEHAAGMNRTALRYAIEHLDPDQRAYYRSL